MAIDCLKDKPNAVYVHSIHNVTLFSNKKKWNSDTCYDVGWISKHHVTWEKPDPKAIYCTMPFNQKSQVYEERK